MSRARLTSEPGLPDGFKSPRSQEKVPSYLSNKEEEKAQFLTRALNLPLSLKPVSHNIPLREERKRMLEIR